LKEDLDGGRLSRRNQAKMFRHVKVRLYHLEPRLLRNSRSVSLLVFAT
jgi:hypothetical protein